ncbi:MFS transporter [Qaidamihabitans albus]|uniref:MFS transporter n=1 Tax=Qaidamihabitans albus TaxID=2795733 RepID=UPI0018F1F192|nr:MFS transporter [Qaidamihabitans albus]
MAGYDGTNTKVDGHLTRTAFLRRRVVLGGVMAGVVGRVPFTASFALFVLVGDVSGSTELGLQLAGVVNVAVVLSSSFWGYLSDRHGIKLALILSNLLSCVVFLLLLAVFAAEGNSALLFALAAVHGCAQAPQISGYRLLLMYSVSSRYKTYANSVDVVSMETGFVLGPLSVVAAAKFVDMAVIMVVLAVTSVLMAVLVQLMPAGQRSEHRGKIKVLRVRGGWTTIYVAASVGVMAGVVEATGGLRLIADMGDASDGGLISISLSVGCLLGGLINFVTTGARPAVRLKRVGAAVIGMSVACGVMGGVISAPSIIVTTIVCGICLAPVHAEISMMIMHDMPVQVRAHWLATYNGVLILAAGAGRYASGVAASWDLVTPAVLGAAVVGTCASIAVSMHRTRRA